MHYLKSLRAKKSQPSQSPLNGHQLNLQQIDLESGWAETRARQQLEVLGKLSQEIQQLESPKRWASAKPASSSGCSALDAMLPHEGYLPGSVVEYLRATAACGASTLALAAAAAAMRRAADGFLVLVDSGHCFYPPALANHGIDLAKVILVRPDSQADALWAVDQALRTLAVVAVVAELERIDDRAARRLQLAAEQGEGLALLLRGATACKQPSWADVQWLVRPAKRVINPQQRRSFEIQLVRVRGGRAGGAVGLEVDPLTGKLELAKSPIEQAYKRDSHEQAGTPSKSAVHLASQLANSKDRCRRAAVG